MSREGIQHRQTNGAGGAGRAEPTPLRVIEVVKATQRLAAAQAEHLLFGPAGKQGRRPVDLAHAPVAVDQHHSDGCILVDDGQLGQCAAQCLFRLRPNRLGSDALGDVVQNTVRLFEIPLLIALYSSIHRDNDVRTILPHHLKFHTLRHARDFEAKKSPPEIVQALGSQKIAKLSANHLLLHIAKQIKPRLIDLRQASILIQRLVTQGGVLVEPVGIVPRSHAMLPLLVYTR
jgi:hypothetical protein